jgi:ATP diphosphatase
MTARPDALSRLLAVMRRLRAPEDGCPWDRAQTFASIAPHTIEEAYEVADAVAGGDPARIRDELGDLLFQVVFYAELARERGWFDFDAVAAGIAEKLVRRHPHVFGGSVPESGEAHSRSWEALKALERAARKLGRRAAEVSFDFPDAAAARSKVEEELAELEAEAGAQAPRTSHAAARKLRLAEEFGDVLFAMVNWGRHLGLDAEESLRQANGKFERRFRCMEALAAERGLDLTRLDGAAWESLWLAAKARE